MKGLLIKDFKLMKNQKTFFMMLLFLAVMFVVTDMASGSFVVGYLTFCGSIFILSTISYDEFNHGNTFLFTLPFDRKTYAAEKYVLALILGGSCWLLSCLITTVAARIRMQDFHPDEWAQTCLMILVCALLMLSVLIPIQIKFGGEKGRIALFIMWGGVMAVVFVAAKILDIMDLDIDSFFNRISSLSITVSVLIGLAVSCICLLISYRISTRILEKKEF